MKSLLRGPLVPLLCVAAMVVIWGLSKKGIASNDAYNNWTMIILLAFVAWEFWTKWEDRKKKQLEESQK